MKSHLFSFLMSVSVLLTLVTSCVNSEVSEPLADAQAGKYMPALSEQVTYMEASVSDLNALIDELDSECTPLVDAREALLKHIEHLKAGVSLKDAGKAAISLQSRLAGAVASVDVEQDAELSIHAEKVEKGVMLWLGKDLSAVYPLTYASSKVAGLVSDMENSKLYVDGIASDVEAGLRNEIGSEEITSLDRALTSEMNSAMEMEQELSKLVSDVEQEYGQFMELAASQDSDYDMERLKSLNKSVEQTLKSVDDSFAGLVARVAECEAQLADMLERIAALEDKVEDLNKLLESIQSLTFLSEVSSESAVAHYDLDLSSRYDDGKARRTPSGNIDLNYLVRPASAAKVFADEALWNNGIDIIGYYAEMIQTKSVNPSDFIDFDIISVESDQVSGLVSIQVSNDLSEDFYMKRTGAKMALSVTSDLIDITSKFVEIVPKDASGRIYIEELELSATELEIPASESVTLKATVLPAESYNLDVVYTTSNYEVAQVTSDGVVTAGELGTSVITVTADGVDEWGQTLTAKCNVKVVPNMRITGPIYVEEGKSINLEIESTEYVDPNNVTWASSNTTYATVDGNVVTGVMSYFDTNSKEYKTIDITATIGTANPVVLTHQIRVVAKQPKAVSISNLAGDAGSLTMKLGSTFSMESTILPADVSTSLFRIVYLSQNTDVFSVDYYSGLVSAKAVGAAVAEIRVLADGQYNYYFPKGNEVRRYVTVNVEPYYVDKVVLPESLVMNPDQITTITPEFISDVEGHQPTHTDITWSSSRPDIVSINPQTGEMTAKAEGTSVITATTFHSMSVPSGSAQKSAQCIVTVEKPTVPIHVGDYYYSDGTWSTEKLAGKTVIGVVFATVNAAVADAELFNDYPGCTHGLVVATTEYSYPFGYIATGTSSTGKWFIEKGYTNNSTTAANGYSNTMALQEYDADKDPNGNILAKAMARKGSGAPDTHASAVAPPASASKWYIPSYYEMSLLYQNLSEINATLNSIGASPVNATGYWSSSLQWTTDKYNDILNLYTFDMSTGAWGSSATNRATECPVRVILAF